MHVVKSSLFTKVPFDMLLACTEHPDLTVYRYVLSLYIRFNNLLFLYFLYHTGRIRYHDAPGNVR